MITFEEFFRELWGYEPHPWQLRLYKEVEKGSWPEAVALPTGSGKSALLDMAILQMATKPDAPRRIVYVVNRRLIVDQAEERATKIAEKLAQALSSKNNSPLQKVAEGLARLSRKGVPLEVVKIRGGLQLQRHPVSDPSQPTVILTTVDQVGSRLLFRAYGHSSRAWPIEAGIFAIDTLYLLDEAHLEAPFLKLLNTLAREVAGIASRIGRPGLQVVALTATPETLSLNTQGVLREVEADLEHHSEWKVSRPVRLVWIKRKDRIKALVREALQLHNEVNGAVVVFCNQVGQARQVFQELKQKGNVLLLTGRIRPFDRDRILQEDLQRRLKEGEVDFVVTTQTLEVGADLSFRGLVTLICPLAALRQRIGRLGRHGEPDVRGVLLLEEEIDKLKASEVYPYALDEIKAAQQWIKGLERSEVDFGIWSQRNLFGQNPPPKEAWGLSAEAPEYTEDFLRLFAITDPPIPQLAVEPFIHGMRPASPDVYVAFRRDITERMLADRTALRLLEDCFLKPHAYEVLPVPVWVMQQFLTTGKGDEVSDVEATDSPEGEDGSRGGGRPVLRIKEDRLQVISPGQIRPGDVLVLPATYGGADAFGWHPEAKGPVRDVAEACPPGGRPPHLFRLHPDTLLDALDPEKRRALEEQENFEQVWRQTFALLRDYWQRLQNGDQNGNPGILQKISEELEKRLEVLGVPGPEVVLPEEYADIEEFLAEAEKYGRAVVRKLLEWLHRLVESPWAPAVGRVLSELDRARIHVCEGYPGVVIRLRGESLSIGGDQPVSLEEHEQRVCEVLSAFISSLGLSEDLTDNLKGAAQKHDRGKRDPRQQLWMRLTAPPEAQLPEVLAKSGTRMGPAEIARARKMAGYPRGQRHELQAAAAYREKLSELSVYLIGTHHGHGRPFPVSPDEDMPDLEFELEDGVVARAGHGLDRFDSGWAELFFKLSEHYTPWGLAYLEALLRLADQEAS